MKHQIKLTNASALLLTSILSQPGWAAGIEDILHGGAILVEVIPDLKPKFADEAKGKLDTAWLDVEVEYSFSEKQRDCAKRAITKSVDKLTPGKPILGLARAFGLGDS